jgi:uncharacterized protein (TIGR02145 family)
MTRINRIHYLLFFLWILLFTSSCDEKKNDGEATVADIDGNIYHAVTIGTQVWMLEDLKTTHYRNGDPIPDVTDNTHWENLSSGAFCAYENDAEIGDTYGLLYNWYAINDERNIAPYGWHIPSNEEWLVLANYLGGASIAGGKLKESGTLHWLSPNKGATNESGFTALPAGCRMANGSFVSINVSGRWWRKDEFTAESGVSWYMAYSHDLLGWAFYLKQYGFSVRCIKD